MSDGSAYCWSLEKLAWCSSTLKKTPRYAVPLLFLPFVHLPFVPHTLKQSKQVAPPLLMQFPISRH